MHKAEAPPGCVAFCHGPVSDGIRRSGRKQRSRCPESQCAGSCRRSDLPEVLFHRGLDFRETLRAVGVRVNELGWILAMGLSIRLRRHPALTIRGKFSLVSDEFADTTDREQSRCDERCAPQRGRRGRSGSSDRHVTGHRPPLSFIHSSVGEGTAIQRCTAPNDASLYKNTGPRGTGGSLVPLGLRTRIYDVGRGSGKSAERPNAFSSDSEAYAGLTDGTNRPRRGHLACLSESTWCKRDAVV